MPSAASGPAGPGHAVSGEQTRLPGGDDPVQRRGARRGGFDGLTPLPFRTVAIDRYLETIYCIAGEDEPGPAQPCRPVAGRQGPHRQHRSAAAQGGGLRRCELDRRITLTPAGSAAAQAIVRRHRLAEWPCSSGAWFHYVLLSVTGL